MKNTRPTFDSTSSSRFFKLRKMGILMICFLCYFAAVVSGGAQQLAQYGFEGNVLDTSGNAHHGVNHSVTYTGGVIGGQAGIFNGTSSYVDLNNPATTGPLKPALPVTITAWVYVNDTTGVQRIVSTDNSDNSTVYAGCDLSIASGNPCCDYGDGVAAGPTHRRSLTGSALLSTGQWYHLAAVIQGATNMQLYVNGLPINGNYSGTGGALGYTTATSKIGTGNAANFFNGNIDDVRIYHAALTPDQIGLIARGGLGYWAFDEATGTTTADLTGDALTGTLANSPLWTAGLFGDALTFNGTSSYVNLNNNTTVNPLKSNLPITMGAWVKLSSTTGVQRVFSSDNSDNTTIIAGYDLSINSGVPACEYGDAAGPFGPHRRTKTGTTVLMPGTWYYISAVIQGPTNMQVYVNGVDDGGTYSGTGGTMAYTTASSKIATGNTVNFVNGILDEVSVFNKALTPYDLGAAETVGGGSISSPAVGPQPSYGIGGTGFTLVKNWNFGTNGTIRNIADMNANFQYHDQFNGIGSAIGYGAVSVAPDTANALAGQPIEGTNTGGAPVRTFFADYLRTYLVPLNGATTVTVSSHNAGSGSFQAKWTLPHGGSLQGQDIIWETRVRYVTPPYFWFAIWNAGNQWNHGAEMDLIESFGYDNGGGSTNYVGRYWHSNSVATTNHDQVNYSNWPGGMSSVGINTFDATQYHIWTLAYYKDNSFAFYVDGTRVQYGSNYNWTLGATSTGTPVNMNFLFDGTWGNSTVPSVNHSLPASSLAGTYYEWNYSRVYLR